MVLFLTIEFAKIIGLGFELLTSLPNDGLRHCNYYILSSKLTVEMSHNKSGYELYVLKANSI